MDVARETTPAASAEAGKSSRIAHLQLIQKACLCLQPTQHLCRQYCHWHPLGTFVKAHGWQHNWLVDGMMPKNMGSIAGR